MRTRQVVRYGLIAAVVVLLAALGVPGASADSRALRQTVPPEVDGRIGAKAAVLVDAGTGAILYARRPFDELPPASLTKMVTALVAIERGRPDQLVEPKQAYAVVPVLIGIEPGDALRLEDALYGLLLNSGNDAAMAIAESVGEGSIPRFVGWMNQLTRRLGLTHTRFLNPHGLDEDGHVSSAYDMAVIGRALMRQPALAHIVGERRRLVEGPPRWLFQTTNPLLGVYAGADGIKTGYEDRAGLCLAATAERDGRRAVAVVLNSGRYAADAAALLDAAFADQAWGKVPAPARVESRSSPGMLRADLHGASGPRPRTLFRASRVGGSSARAFE